MVSEWLAGKRWQKAVAVYQVLEDGLEDDFHRVSVDRHEGFHLKVPGGCSASFQQGNLRKAIKEN